MVSIVENWAVIIGTVIGIGQADVESNTTQLDVQIDTVKPYETYPMLVTQKPGEQATIRIKNIELDDGLVNKPIEIRVRRGRDPNTLFAAPDWKPANGQ